MLGPRMRACNNGARIKGIKKIWLPCAAKRSQCLRQKTLLQEGSMSRHRTRGASRAVVLLCGLSAATTSSIVLAQAPAGDKPIEEVIVTGSRIARPNLESPVPVTTVTGEEIYHTGSTSLGDLLNDLPSLRSTFSQSNSSRFLGTSGLNLLDLRGLG